MERNKKVIPILREKNTSYMKQLWEGSVRVLSKDFEACIKNVLKLKKSIFEQLKVR